MQKGSRSIIQQIRAYVDEKKAAYERHEGSWGIKRDGCLGGKGTIEGNTSMNWHLDGVKTEKCDGPRRLSPTKARRSGE